MLIGSEDGSAEQGHRPGEGGRCHGCGENRQELYNLFCWGGHKNGSERWFVDNSILAGILSHPLFPPFMSKVQWFKSLQVHRTAKRRPWANRGLAHGGWS